MNLIRGMKHHKTLQYSVKVTLFTSNLLRVKVMIDMPHRMLSSAGSIVAVPDTATEAIYMSVRYIRFGRVYRSRSGYCDRSYIHGSSLYTVRPGISKPHRILQHKLYTMRYATYDALRYEQLSRSLERSWFF